MAEIIKSLITSFERYFSFAVLLVFFPVIVNSLDKIEEKREIANFVLDQKLRSDIGRSIENCCDCLSKTQFNECITRDSLSINNHLTKDNVNRLKSFILSSHPERSKRVTRLKNRLKAAKISKDTLIAIDKCCSSYYEIMKKKSSEMKEKYVIKFPISTLKLELPYSWILIFFYVLLILLALRIIIPARDIIFFCNNKNNEELSKELIDLKKIKLYKKFVFTPSILLSMCSSIFLLFFIHHESRMMLTLEIFLILVAMVVTIYSYILTQKSIKVLNETKLKLKTLEEE